MFEFDLIFIISKCGHKIKRFDMKACEMTLTFHLHSYLDNTTQHNTTKSIPTRLLTHIGVNTDSNCVRLEMGRIRLGT